MAPSVIFVGDGLATSNIPAPGPGKHWRAFGIHPSSTIDVCKIGGELLGPRQLIYSEDDVPKLEMVRGVRTPVSLFPQPGGEICQLVLVGFRDCDDVEVPGPRTAYVAPASRFLYGTDIAQGNFTRVARVPFMGRRHAVFHLSLLDTDSSAWSISYYTQGIRFLDRRSSVLPGVAMVGGINTTTCFSVQTQSAIVSGVNLTTAVNQSINVGGYDNEESFDELEFFVRPDAVPANNRYLNVEVDVFGEKNGP